MKIQFQDVLKSSVQNGVVSSFDLGSPPSNSGPKESSDGPTPLKTSSNKFDYNGRDDFNSQSFSNEQPLSYRSNFKYQNHEVPNIQTYSKSNELPLSGPFGYINFENLTEEFHKSLPQSNRIPLTKSDSKETENDIDEIPASLPTSNGPSCNSAKQLTDKEINFSKNKPPSLLSTLGLLNSHSLTKRPINILKISGDVYLNSDILSAQPKIL